MRAVENLLRFPPMQSVVADQATAPPARPLLKNWSVRAILLVGALGALWFILCHQLSGEWSHNEQYNYGWFVPFFALYLFWLRWQDRPMEGRAPSRPGFGTSQRASLQLIAIPALLLLLPLRLFEIGNPDWRPLGWIHTGLVATLTLLSIWYVGGKPWLRHFAFPIAFFFVAVPWVNPIETPIIQGLMHAVAAAATEAVALFGIPAQLQGNLIRVSSGLVGVNEACSGVRSLQTSLMIGLLFGELKRLSILRRVALVAAAVAIALTANFLRAFFLVWIAATKSISEIARWHDIAGYTIVALVFVGSLVLAMLLGRSKGQIRKSKVEKEDGAPRNGTVRESSFLLSNFYFPLPSFCFAVALAWIVAVEIAAAGWYRAHESNLVESIRWEVQWPESAPNFRELEIDELVRRTLRFDRGYAASWTWPAASSAQTSQPFSSRSVTCVLYFFRWNPGRNTALLANLHRPDVCLPTAGWIQVADTGVRNYPVTTSFALPFRHFEFRHGARENPSQQVAHAFYCLWEDRAPSPAAAGSKLPQMSGSRSSWTRAERIRTVLEGRRHLGQQVMEFVALTRGSADLDEINARFVQALPELVRVTRDH
jgi:exosortase